MRAKTINEFEQGGNPYEKLGIGTASFNGSKIIIYRAMEVSRKWLKNLDNINNFGLYWSWEKENAIPQRGPDNELMIIIEAEVDINLIDWNKIIEINIEDDWMDESEIELNAGTPLTLISIKDEDGHNYYKKNNKIFT